MLLLAIRSFGAALVLSGSVVVAAPANARSLQAIYQDMVALNAQQPCDTRPLPPSSVCKASIRPKINLAYEVAPLLKAMPAPLGGPVDNALGGISYLTQSANKWIASDCEGDPSFVALRTACTGDSIQSYFDGITRNIGKIVAIDPVDLTQRQRDYVDFAGSSVCEDFLNKQPNFAGIEYTVSRIQVDGYSPVEATGILIKSIDLYCDFQRPLLIQYATSDANNLPLKLTPDGLTTS